MGQCADRGPDAGGGGQSRRVLDLLHQLVLEPLAARGHHRHSGMDDVVDVAGREISDRGHDRLEHVLLEVLATPMLDVGGGQGFRSRKLANNQGHFRRGCLPSNWPWAGPGQAARIVPAAAGGFSGPTGRQAYARSAGASSGHASSRAMLCVWNAALTIVTAVMMIRNGRC